MTDVVAAFPSTSKNSVVRVLVKLGVHPKITWWTADRLTDRSIETWIDGSPVATTPVSCGVPQGSLCSPVLFALTLAEALAQAPEGVSHVDDCSSIISFNARTDFQ